MSKINAVILTVSDTRSPGDDLSGNKLAELLTDNDAVIIERLIVTDDLSHLRETLFSLAEREDIDLIVTAGGTGFSARDNTPEATRSVIEREAPGLAEAMRAAGKHPMSMLSRGVCGIRGTTLIVNLPGSPRGVEECFEVIRPVLPHAIELIRGNQPH
ncbi:MAG: MogA/MoaB family molybdenum cofactor biosynthesis protein [Pyrinomonadaceae bacterium]|nr:MogA/MoaB family molybdenum cofactor biosynthesis protein [Pyrinomonadaceae bacterium]